MLAHCQVTQAKLKPMLAKELTKPALLTAFKGGVRFSHPQKQNKFVLRIEVCAD